MKNQKQIQYSSEHGDVVEAYRLNIADTIFAYKGSTNGLSQKEAQNRFLLNGPNKLTQVKKDKLIIKFIRQFKDLMLMLLIFSGIFSIYVGEPQTATVLFVIVIINALIGFTQEYKAEKLMDSLEKLVIPTAKVLRNDTIQEIPSANIVTGDIIVLEEGDSVPADARVIEESELSTNDFALTGESNPSRKFTHAIEGNVLLANRHNLVFMGTTVATGSAKCIVIATGMQTELGRIARLSQGTKNDLSPLQKEMTSLAVTLTKAALILTAILMAIAWQGDATLKEIIIFAVGVASALIPQGLPAEVNTALASAAGRLAKARVLVKKLSAVETLGATSVILTDKTGTLTKNEMTVQQLRIGDDIYSVTGIGYENNGTIFDSNNSVLSSKDLKDNEIFFVTGFFASNASVHAPDESHANWFCIGDPTEGSLITLASKARLDVNILSNIKEQHEYSFDSVRKRMSSVRVYNNELTVFVKGAPESVLQECTHYISNGVMKVFTNAHKNEVLAQDDEWAKNAMRNLAFAYKTIPHDTKLSDYTMQDAESKLIFLGIASMIDPPREEVNAAMQAARDAYVPVNIITGDNALTAKAVAVKAGFAKDPKDITLVTGSELSSMSDSDVIKLVTIGGTIF
ncbi:MAG: P-type Ca2+ transporter type, partial [Patescibacteria group bacterium]|nr:P-type Ca2+ transporter type [Patescibacteria group bacterium]